MDILALVRKGPNPHTWRILKQDTPSIHLFSYSIPFIASFGVCVLHSVCAIDLTSETEPR
jgi:hypothetical protein